jgi:hypothetical protein
LNWILFVFVYFQNFLVQLPILVGTQFQCKPSVPPRNSQLRFAGSGSDPLQAGRHMQSQDYSVSWPNLVGNLSRCKPSVPPRNIQLHFTCSGPDLPQGGWHKQSPDYSVSRYICKTILSLRSGSGVSTTAGKVDAEIYSDAKLLIFSASASGLSGSIP